MVCPDPSWTYINIVKAWDLRWSCEVLHREGKQDIGPKDFHVSTYQGIVGWIYHVPLCHTVLTFMHQLSKSCTMDRDIPRRRRPKHQRRRQSRHCCR